MRKLILVAILLMTFITASSQNMKDTSELYKIDMTMINQNGSVERKGNTLEIRWTGMPVKGKINFKWIDVKSGNENNITGNITNSKISIKDPNPDKRTIFALPAGGKTFIKLAERKVPAEGLDNLRDHGGYKTIGGKYTKWGLLYRSDTPYKARQNGYKYMDNMKLGYIFDLRNYEEVSRKPVPSFDKVIYKHAQMLDTPPAYSDVSWDTNEKIYSFVSTPRAETFYIDTNEYMASVPENHKSLKSVFDALLNNEDGEALIWHCAGGKDRTGIVSAIVLMALGVPEETIVNDYLLTNEYRKEFDKKELEEMRVAFNNDPAAVKGFLAIQQARPEYIKSGINKIKNDYGTLENYLQEELEINENDLDKLKAMYTE